MVTAWSRLAPVRGSLGFPDRRRVLGVFLASIHSGALAACTVPPAGSAPDAVASVEGAASTYVEPPPTVVPSQPDLPERSAELPSCDPMPAAEPTPRARDLRRASKLYDFRLEASAAGSRCGDEVGDPPGRLTIFRKGTRKVVQRVRLASLSQRALGSDDDSPILVDDFDFDGHEDLAVHTGDSGPYGSATYGVFLFVPASGTFVHAPAWSRLAEESLAPLRADAARRRLVVASKSGCCVHWVEEHEVRGGVPRLVKRETEELDSEDRCVLTVETRRRGGGLRREKRACQR